MSVNSSGVNSGVVKDKSTVSINKSDPPRLTRVIIVPCKYATVEEAKAAAKMKSKERYQLNKESIKARRRQRYQDQKNLIAEYQKRFGQITLESSNANHEGLDSPIVQISGSPVVQISDVPIVQISNSPVVQISDVPVVQTPDVPIVYVNNINMDTLNQTSNIN